MYICTYKYIQTTVAPETVSKEQLNIALYDLQQWPTELIDWPCDNSERRDVYLDHSVGINSGRCSQLCGTTAFPSSERSDLRWNATPFELKSGSGYSEYDPGAWMTCYWFGRYYGWV